LYIPSTLNYYKYSSIIGLISGIIYSKKANAFYSKSAKLQGAKNCMRIPAAQ